MLPGIFSQPSIKVLRQQRKMQKSLDASILGWKGQ
jgi:hypothetical protein